MKAHLLSLTLALSMLAVGCRATSSDQAPTGAVPVQPQSFMRQWKAALPLNGDRISELYLRGRHLFVYTGNHNSYVLSADGGTVLTSAAVTGASTGLFPPVVLGERIVYPTNTTLEVYDFKGKRLRSIDVGSALRSGAAGQKDTVYFGTDHPGGGRLAAYDIARESNMPLWQIMTPDGAIEAAPAISGSAIYFGTTAGRIYAVSADRNAIWPLEKGSFLTDGQILADVQADDTGVYFASTDTKLYAVQRTTGKTQWIFFAGQPLTQAPVVTDTAVYQPVGRSGIAAIDKINGQYSRRALWMAPDATRFLSQDKQYVYLLDGENRIVAHDRRSGQIAFTSQRTDFQVFATNTGDDSLIYAARHDGTIYAIRPVLKAGAVGELVLDVRSLPALAVAR